MVGKVFCFNTLLLLLLLFVFKTVTYRWYGNLKCLWQMLQKKKRIFCFSDQQLSAILWLYFFYCCYCCQFNTFHQFLFFFLFTFHFLVFLFLFLSVFLFFFFFFSFLRSFPLFVYCCFVSKTYFNAPKKVLSFIQTTK